MPAYQRTFDLIPTTLAAPPVYRPPMTSKAAKKAYSKKNAGPQISRVEQKRIEKEELERQKKEFEREKALKKARAARDKKAEKERKEKEERKKRGEPEPKKGVRASQSMISAFVRGGTTGAKRKWEGIDCVEDDSEGTIGDGSEYKRKDGPPAKRVAVEEDLDCESESGAENDTRMAHIRGNEMSAKGLAVVEDSGDEYGDSLSQSDLLEMLDTNTLAVDKKEADLRPPIPARKPPDPMSPSESPKLPRRKVGMEDDILDDAMLEEMLTTQILSEAAEASLKSDAMESLLVESAAATETHRENLREEPRIPPTERRTVNSQDYKASKVTRPPLQPRSNNMPPPKIPSRVVTKPTFLSNTIRIPESHQANHNQPINHTVNDQILPAVLDQFASRITSMAPPSATQAFLEDHIDDFFPSPTQQVRELMEDIDDNDFLSNSQIAKDISPQNAIPQEVEVDSISKSKLPEILKPNFEDPYFGDLFCTQDLAMSSQEEAELQSPSRPVEDVQGKVEDKPARPRRRFFEEKEDDLYRAALHESRMLAEKEAQRRSPPLREQQKSGSGYVRPLATDYKDDDVFGADEHTLIQVAIHESKLEAQRKEICEPNMMRTQQNATTENRGPEKFQPPSFDYGDDNDYFSDDDTLIGVPNEIHLPTKQAQNPTVTTQKVPLRKDDAPRTMKRVQSMTSDYGDDEFRGCSQELAALC